MISRILYFCGEMTLNFDLMEQRIRWKTYRHFWWFIALANRTNIPIIRIFMVTRVDGSQLNQFLIKFCRPNFLINRAWGIITSGCWIIYWEILLCQSNHQTFTALDAMCSQDSGQQPLVLKWNDWAGFGVASQLVWQRTGGKNTWIASSCGFESCRDRRLFTNQFCLFLSFCCACDHTCMLRAALPPKHSFEQMCICREKRQTCCVI